LMVSNMCREEAEATISLVKDTLRKGQCVYLKLKVIRGQKSMAVIRCRTGSYPRLVVGIVSCV
ncbi:hypothetical protein, partial [Escherichia coli]|uniref:hypothetical protein n=1 Tax=Escherichia coli TaxID=562 RepID=UPI003F758243